MAARDATEADLDACVALAIAAASWTPETWRSVLALDLVDEDRRLVVVESESGVSGYGRACVFSPGVDAPADVAPGGWYLNGLFVRPSCRGSGLGSALVEARLERIRALADEAWYLANARNARSIALHHRFGFREVTRAFSYPGATFAGGEGILFRVDL